MIIETPGEALKNDSYAASLKELLYQLADDDFVIAFRGSEWLGLAPHIEEDVAYSSITQNTMGHAFLYYELLSHLEEGDVDQLAHERKADERRNAIYFEKKNGEGDYLEEPRYDWALAVVRQFIYETAKRIKLESLLSSSYQPLSDTAQKVLMEQTYHLAHWKIWITQLLDANEESKERILARLQEAFAHQDEIMSLGHKGADMEEHELIENEEVLKQRWQSEMEEVVGAVPEHTGDKTGDGRTGQHTGDLDQALQTLAEVYETDRNAVW